MVYLSGMMDGVSIEEGNGWRLKATKKLEEAGFLTYNPYDGKSKDKNDHGKYTTNEIFHRDIYFLDKSDIVLANLVIPEMIENKKIPVFTLGEMFLANRDRKPVIAYTNCLNGRAGYDAIVTKTCENLDDCIDYIILNYS